jgi:dTDP-4-dehydrorhamnose 3,5-epimerase
MESVLKIEPKLHGDHRGFFAETYSRARYSDLGIRHEFVQDNHSLSAHVGTLRGLHFQGPPHAQAKLVRCGRGAIFDVSVDIRQGSPTYGHWVGHELTEDNGHQLYVPIGFAHGFLTLHPNSEIVYKCSDYYAPETEGALIWNDPDIGIDWPTTNELTISEKDKAANMFKDFESPFIFGVNS